MSPVRFLFSSLSLFLSSLPALSESGEQETAAFILTSWKWSQMLQGSSRWRRFLPLMVSHSFSTPSFDRRKKCVESIFFFGLFSFSLFFLALHPVSLPESTYRESPSSLSHGQQRQPRPRGPQGGPLLPAAAASSSAPASPSAPSASTSDPGGRQRLDSIHGPVTASRSTPRHHQQPSGTRRHRGPSPGPRRRHRRKGPPLSLPRVEGLGRCEPDPQSVGPAQDDDAPSPGNGRGVLARGGELGVWIGEGGKRGGRGREAGRGGEGVVPSSSSSSSSEPCPPPAARGVKHFRPSVRPRSRLPSDDVDAPCERRRRGRSAWRGERGRSGPGAPCRCCCCCRCRRRRRRRVSIRGSCCCCGGDGGDGSGTGGGACAVAPPGAPLPPRERIFRYLFVFLVEFILALQSVLFVAVAASPRGPPHLHGRQLGADAGPASDHEELASERGRGGVDPRGRGRWHVPPSREQEALLGRGEERERWRSERGGRRASGSVFVVFVAVFAVAVAPFSPSPPPLRRRRRWVAAPGESSSSSGIGSSGSGRGSSALQHQAGRSHRGAGHDKGAAASSEDSRETPARAARAPERVRYLFNDLREYHNLEKKENRGSRKRLVFFFSWEILFPSLSLKKKHKKRTAAAAKGNGAGAVGPGLHSSTTGS